eukprot:CAMPEP_0201726212 /NCGR_PEP_ID=MMETSP0593-20130828/9322_1 /ASSEMBLY_ACC=CAM_ASM_000672 /TAXON_ID=267983 /ORGANISM="Skeletonema japonicum, Strain CCMP2506" /LENGTH=525 /DNA_ID=CAMNT_0048217683 /DNA_START=243 /DNA_END=1820 /DNA_ORIENTATION=+
MDSFESLLKAAQQIDSPDFNVKVVVEMRQRSAMTTPLSTPPRARPAATMPPPPSPPRVQLASYHNPPFVSISSGVLSMPSLYSPHRALAPLQYHNCYVARALAAEQSSSGPLIYDPPTSALAAMMMTSPSSAPLSSWPYIDLSPRFSGYHAVPVVPTAAADDLSSAATSARPFCLFPAAAASSPKAHQLSPQASQGVANHYTVATAMTAAPTATSDGFFKPIAEYPRSATNNTAFVSPEPKKSRAGTGHRGNRSNHSRCNTTAAATSTGFLELKPSSKDSAPPQEQEESADTKMRIVVTPATEVNNNNDIVDEDNTTFIARPWPIDDDEHINMALPALFDEEDIPYVNPSHYIIGSEILEPFVVPKYQDDAAAAVSTNTRTISSSVYKNKKGGKKAKNPTPVHKKSKNKMINFRAGSIAFRCRFCKHSPHKDRYPLATIYPESIEGLYRANLRFQANHLRVCKECPRELKDCLRRARQNNDHRSFEVQGGVRKYWVETAARKGFRKVTVNGKGRIGFATQEYYSY